MAVQEKNSKSAQLKIIKDRIFDDFALIYALWDVDGGGDVDLLLFCKL